MTDLSYMQHPDVQAAQRAWQKHFDGCEACQHAAGSPQACEEGKRLHEAEVMAAQEAYRSSR